ncbi:DUF3795 domain-containing protein [Saccharicrinis sp. FJH2]|uniref:DUF3795 domain-containing protein n=1 Tax=Saccharicrinis sp. FJH65 TaxID=3344659 RepID=UPI0035F38741
MQNDLNNKFGPCGLLCEKCFAYANGQIKYHAEQLKANLGNFDNYAKRFVTLLDEPVFNKYHDFNELLNLLSSGNCQGCRKQECHLFRDCMVRHCYKGKTVDYCYQCTDFPCDNTGFDNNLKQRWLKINRRIREIGLENYYDEIKDKPRY